MDKIEKGLKMKRILKENENPPLSSLQENIYRRISVKMNIFKK
jgi:hypothetical protein